MSKISNVQSHFEKCNKLFSIFINSLDEDVKGQYIETDTDYPSGTINTERVTLLFDKIEEVA